MARTHQLVLTALTLLVSLAPATGCRKREICGGRGMIVDTRPLSGVLAEIGTPTGSTLCKGSSDGPENDKHAETYRLVELGKNANEGFELWKKHLEAKGWKETTAPNMVLENAEAETAAVAGKQKASCTTSHSFAKDTVPGQFVVGVSYCGDVWKEIGWTNVRYLKK